MSLDSNVHVTKSELIDALAENQLHLSHKDVEMAVNVILEHIADSLAHGERVEIRGFGSLSLSYRPSRQGRNPKTGESVLVPAKCAPHFKPGRELRHRVDNK